jgi:hypothetical protein
VLVPSPVNTVSVMGMLYNHGAVPGRATHSSSGRIVLVSSRQGTAPPHACHHT